MPTTRLTPMTVARAIADLDTLSDIDDDPQRDADEILAAFLQHHDYPSPQEILCNYLRSQGRANVADAYEAVADRCSGWHANEDDYVQQDRPRGYSQSELLRGVTVTAKDVLPGERKEGRDAC